MAVQKRNNIKIFMFIIIPILISYLFIFFWNKPFFQSDNCKESGEKTNNITSSKRTNNITSSKRTNNITSSQRAKNKTSSQRAKNKTSSQRAKNKTSSSQYGKEKQKEDEIEYKKDLSLIYKRDKQNILKRKLMNLLDSSDILKKINKTNTTLFKKVEKWKNDSYPYMEIERYAIPMISTISAGKSSSLNFMLNFNILQIRENPTTKFCLLIRDNKKYKKGKIFTVTVEKRAEVSKYNFKKGKPIDDDPKKFVEKMNNQIQNLQEREKDIEKYFFLLEIDTGLFEGEYEKYSGLIEFIDIPGLNENELENNFYFKNIIPFIKPNFLFPILILDAKKFYSADVFNIFKEIFSPYTPKNMDNNTYDFENQNYILQMNKNNSFFLINKLNLLERDERTQVIDVILKDTAERLNIKLELNRLIIFFFILL